MKQSLSSLRLVLAVTALLQCGLPAGAVTFTNDAAISFRNTNFDGADIIVTNCTLTVDGLHSFASLQVLDGGNLTHTFAQSGLLENRRTITHEQQLLSATNAATLSNANVVVPTILVKDFSGLVTYTNGADYVTSLDTNGMTTLLLTTNSSIVEGSTNLVSYDVLDTPVAAGLSLMVTGDVFVAQGGTINADGKGYDGALGPGAGRSSGSPLSGSGAGHGGYGGQSAALGGTGPSYDAIQQPVSLGSGGGRGYGGVGGAGGGSVKLVVGGNLRVDGTVSANGANGMNNQAGGGSGGSIWLTCQNLSGEGVLSVNGGAGEPSQGGGGGGGRISMRYQGGAFRGATTARGGNGYIGGGAGTICTRANDQSTAQVLVDNGGRAGASTSFFPGEMFDLTAQGGARIALEGSQSFGNLVVNSNAWISLVSQTLTVTNNATIQTGGGIIADGAGYAGNQGPGAGKYYSYSYGSIGGGGGYGGFGATGGTTNAYGGVTYGSVTTPAEFGSGGGGYPPYGLGGAGGGSIRFSVAGMLVLDGRISADGGAGIGEGGGGGSGGSVWVTAGALTGAGAISANGGMGNGFGLTGGGGGGGGRIALQYGMNLFFGLTSARGGNGSGWGGAGTIYTKANSQSWGHVLVDNGGQSGTNTSWSQLGTVDLTVKGGAAVSPPGSQTFGTLLVAPDGWLVVSNQLLTVTGNATIQAGGGILANGTGYSGSQGTGAGKYVNVNGSYIGGGGGYGGCGAAGGNPLSSTYGPPAGGVCYGSVAAPISLGSAGGGYYVNGPGGAGGGAVRLTVTGVLQVDGRISAAGNPGTAPSGGGGSGGTIALTVGTLSGSGTISANGGMGNSLGGGGGGGRIAIQYGTSNFSGLMSAYGGGGYAWGGAGTIYTKADNQSAGLVLVDNGGRSGTNTSWETFPTGDVWVRGGAVLASTYSFQTVGNLVIASNGWVIVTNQMPTISGNVTIQAGGGIVADGTGYAAGLGTGAGRYYSSSSGYVGGGGGYGGYGAAGASGPDYYTAYGGTTYGSPTTPVDFGSGGGGYSSLAPGGAGGGAIRLTVSGTLAVDGRISARGNAGGTASAGGGSGGSIYLSVGTLAGSGVISANGGAGNARGGGGGGGRIAIICTSANTFSGVMSAYGGSGYAAGGAGTIYARAGNQSLGLIIADNGGQNGTNTSWPSGAPFEVTLRNGASLAMPSSSQTIPGNLLIGSNGWIYIAGSAGLNGPTLNVMGNATIQAGGGIIADGGGYSYFNGSTGPGGGVDSGGYSSGGGFGGCGGASGGRAVPGGRAFGSVSAGGPGSAGGTSGTTYAGGAGGGAISLNVTGALQLDGRISSSGGTGITSNAGGGSGGGIVLTAGTLAGSGAITANGGAGSGFGGGGGGGRIVITYTANAFSGVMSAYGGTGYARGGAGTIYTKARSSSWGQVLADNGGQAGTNTSWTPGGTIDLAVTGGAVVSPPAAQTLGNLLVASNGWVNVGNQVLTVTSNATVQAGGGITADGMGSGGNLGPGAGRYGYSSATGNVGGGGGYGGYGASGGSNSLAYGGITYGSVTAPVDLGSGGGSYFLYPSPPGAGGGAIRLNVTGMLLINGRISANGGAGIGQGTGGGSGGSVWLIAGTLAGAGTISANGGPGNGLGGGGGGGRVSLQYAVNAFEGAISAYGAGGYAWGGAGTIYTKASSHAMGQMIVDNGGHSGTSTPVAYLSPLDLTIRGGAVAYPSSPYLLLSNLLISTGGSLTCSPIRSNLDLTVLGYATIDTGGVVTVNGRGFGAGAGPGAGLSANQIGSGAGYGGPGGASSASSGGGTYGSPQQPVDWGSGGGLGWGAATGGSEGGGAIRLTVGGALTVNGRLSADGNAGMQDDAGGGSGGSVWLAAGALAGIGAIAADGGAGELYDGGGGGGGRVAICTPINAFGGQVSAAGGPGESPGQAGSIFYAVTPPAPQVVSISPTGTLTSAVSSAEVLFDTPMNPPSVAFPGVSLIAPGSVIVDGLTATALTPYRFRINFPTQTAQGDYTLTLGPQVRDLYGQSLSHLYMNIFSIAWAVVQGTITDSNGLPVPDVVVQSDGGGSTATTDTNGSYVLGIPPAGTVTVAPTKNGLMFVPGSRTYINVTASITNENYLAVGTTVPALTTEVRTNSLILSWYGIPGIAYQPLYSTNLVDWLPYGGVLSGTNGPLQLVVPMNTDPLEFFRVEASY